MSLANKLFLDIKDKIEKEIIMWECKRCGNRISNLVMQKSKLNYPCPCGKSHLGDYKIVRIPV